MHNLHLKDRMELERFRGPLNATELSYCLNQLCRDYYKTTGGRLYDVLGVLEACKLEFDR